MPSTTGCLAQYYGSTQLICSMAKHSDGVLVGCPDELLEFRNLLFVVDDSGCSAVQEEVGSE